MAQNPGTVAVNRFLANSEMEIEFLRRNPQNQEIFGRVVRDIFEIKEVPFLQIQDTPFQTFHWKLYFPKGIQRQYSFFYLVLIFLVILLPTPVSAEFNVTGPITLEEFSYYLWGVSYFFIFMLCLLVFTLVAQCKPTRTSFFEVFIALLGISLGTTPFLNSIFSACDMEVSSQKAVVFFYISLAEFVICFVWVGYFLYKLDTRNARNPYLDPQEPTFDPKDVAQHVLDDLEGLTN